MAERVCSEHRSVYPNPHPLLAACRLKGQAPQRAHRIRSYRPKRRIIHRASRLLECRGLGSRIQPLHSPRQACSPHANEGSRRDARARAISRRRRTRHRCQASSRREGGPDRPSSRASTGTGKCLRSSRCPSGKCRRRCDRRSPPSSRRRRRGSCSCCRCSRSSGSTRLPARSRNRHGTSPGSTSLRRHWSHRHKPSRARSRCPRGNGPGCTCRASKPRKVRYSPSTYRTACSRRCRRGWA
jgi:hypothetical protein